MRVHFVYKRLLSATLALLFGCNASDRCEGAACPSATASNTASNCTSARCSTNDGGQSGDAGDRANDASASDDASEAGALPEDAGSHPPDATLADAQTPQPCLPDVGVCPTGAPDCCTPCKDGSCSDGLVCVALGDTPAENRCLQCGDDADCQREGFSGVCDDHQCVPCANGDSLPHRGCDDSQPVCSQSSTADDSHCVVCLEHEHCPLQAPYCDEQRCVECRAEANDCGPETPVCDDGNCAACGAHQDCARFDEAPHCDEPSGSCVECLADADCTAPGAARCVENRCVPCDLDTDCAHLPSQHLCHDGLCVECYGKETEACGPGRVCDMLPDSHARYTCTQLQAEQANLCEPCVSDAHCRAGADCVLTQFQGQSTGYFCLWREGGDTEDSPNNCLNVQLYTGSQELTSTDGRSGRYCGLEHSTCQALRDFGQTCESDDNCGASELDDGLCVPYGNESACSYACGITKQCPPLVECDHNGGYCRL